MTMKGELKEINKESNEGKWNYVRGGRRGGRGLGGGGMTNK